MQGFSPFGRRFLPPELRQQQPEKMFIRLGVARWRFLSGW